MWVPDRVPTYGYPIGVPICTKCIEAHEVWPIILARKVTRTKCPR